MNFFIQKVKKIEQKNKNIFEFNKLKLILLNKKDEIYDDII